MGLDLQVLASCFRERDNELLPTANLRFERARELFARLAWDARPCLVRPLPEGLQVGCFEEQGLTFKDVDLQGQRLTFTTPTDLRQLKLPPDISSWNRAVLAFLLALPPDARIGLYWC